MKKQKNINYWQQKFGKLAVITIAAVYLLILVGGIVRSTGSGMGCPDWPKCFGSWVPPTSADQLPSGYKEVYTEKRISKNERLASLFEMFGAGEIAYQLRHDEAILQEAEFNVVKTWIEYANRLVGVVIGLLIMATLALSYKLRKRKSGVFYASQAAFVLVVFQGWLGSVVVSTNLLPWMVTVHMLPALAIVALLIYAAFRAWPQKQNTLSQRRKEQLNWLLIVLMGLSIVQIVIGTQVRETVDEVALANNYSNRENWVDELGFFFYVHRSYSIILLGLHLLLFYLVRKFAAAYSGFNSWSGFLLIVVGIEIATGAVMAYFAIPAILQPMHLLFGTVLFGIQFYLFLLVRSGNSKELTDKNTEECLLQEAGS
jgi:cytochrome c oxidase assembly protein subunit 15